MTLEFTILGCGSSGGVPRIDGDWGDCDPDDPRNARTRCSLLVQRRGPDGVTHVIVDTSPDLRAFAGRQRRRIPMWMDETAHGSLSTRFGYIFLGRGGYPAICDPMRIDPGRDLTIIGAGGTVSVRTFPQQHGAIRSVGLRFSDVAYSPDVDGIPDEAWPALAGLDCWIVDALRWTPHPSHSHVEQTLGWISRAQPRRAVLTNLHIDLDYTQLSARLPEGVEPACDGLKLVSGG